MNSIVFSALVLSLASASSLAAQDASPPATLGELATKAREARIKGDVPNWLDYATRTLALSPDHPDILVSVARANAASGNKAAAIEHLAHAGRRGAGADPSRFAEFKSLAGDPQFEAAAAAVRRNLEPVARAVRFAATPDASEGITYDPVSRRFFSGLEHEGGEGELYAVDMDGKVTTFVRGGGLRQLLGLKVDAERRLLWVVSGRYPEPGPNPPADRGTGGVRAYHLDSGKLVTAVEVDNRPTWVHGFNDMALAADGTVYLTDSNTNAVYRLAPRGKTLELLLRDAKMTFVNGIVLAPDQRTLYVAHLEGISALDVATATRTLLPVPADGSVHSIDGLQLKDGIFYGVQNSPYLQRIVAAALGADGRSIARVWTLNSRTPAGYIQTTAAIAGDHLYVIGGSPAPDIYGGTNPAKPAPSIWRVPLEPPSAG